MASPQLSDLVAALLKSPRGLVAIAAVIGSLVTLVYLFLFKGNDKSSKRSPSKRNSKQVINKSLAAGGTKKSPAKKQVSRAKGAASPQAKKEPSKSKIESSEKSGTKQLASKQGAKKDSNKSTKSSSSSDDADSRGKKAKADKQATKQVASQAQTRAQKDHGEWITVAKKKPRVSARQAKS